MQGILVFLSPAPSFPGLTWILLLLRLCILYPSFVPVHLKLCSSSSSSSILDPMSGVWIVFFLPQLPQSGSMRASPRCRTVNLISNKLAVANKILNCDNCCHNWDLSFLLCDCKYCSHDTMLWMYACFTLESSSHLTVVDYFLCSLKGSFRLTSLWLSGLRDLVLTTG